MCRRTNSLRTSLHHLSDSKRHDLTLILRHIHDVFQKVRASGKVFGLGRKLRRAADLADPQMIVLCGAHANRAINDYSTNPIHCNGQYIPDYELLVILEQCKLARRLEVWETILERYRIDPQASQSIKLIFLTKSHAEVNHQLRLGSFFFRDIKHQGVVLHQAEDFKLARCRSLDPLMRQSAARRAFRWWSQSACDSLLAFELFMKKRRYRRAAFELHQAAEFLYTGAMMVFTGHQFRSHNLRQLERKVSNLDSALFGLLGKALKGRPCRLFSLLNAAYVRGRYSSAFRVTRCELDELAKRVHQLQRVTKRICKERIKSYAHVIVKDR